MMVTVSFPSPAAHLLLHFFNYYAEFPFSEKAVAIHIFSPPLICNLPLQSAGQSTGFRVSALCVQDPFEQNHNVSKNVKSSLLPPVRQAFQSSEKTLRDMISSELTARQDVLSLFKQQALPLCGKKGAAVHSLNLDSATASHLLLDTRYAALADRLSELNVKSAHIRSTLSHILLQSLALKLAREFGFQVSAAEAQEDMSCASPLSCVPPTHMMVPADKQRKRQRPSEEFEEGMEVDEEEEGKVERIKRLRVSEQESAKQLLFDLADGEEGSGYTLMCSAMEESWIHRRRKRRKKERLASASSETAEPMTTPTTPCLSFTLTSVPSFHLATVVLSISNPVYQQPFQQFFAILKKWLLCSSPSQS